MRANSNARTGGEILVDQLLAHGARHAFCVPGESYLAVLDAFHDRDVEVTVCRQEGGAAMMAEAVGKLTGRPGICFVTRGPGATNASPGVHIARQDSTPMILFVGQVARETRDREAFQELDYRAVFGSMAKWATEIDAVERIPEIVSRAFYTATNGRPGPVVVALPEDMLTERGAVADALRSEPVETWPGATDMTRLQKLLWAAERPIVLLGGSRWSQAAWAAMGRFAERLQKLLARIQSADLIVLVGGRLGELPSQGYSLLGIPNPQIKLVHVHPGAEELGRVYRPDLAIHAAPTAFAAALEGLEPPATIRWREQTRAAHADYLAWSEKPTAIPGAVNLGEIMVDLRDRLAPEAILCNGAGNYAGWIHRFYRFRRFTTQLGPVSGSMGYGVPAAVAAKRLHPERTVVCFAGDGCFLMNGQEFATAVQYELPIIVIVVDNGMYGTIRMHQERDYPQRVSATALKNPDFAAYARAFGGFGTTVETTAEFAPAFEAARKSGKPAILHLKLDPEAITPATTLGAIREKALARQGG
jgi:acetolactate synthase-1/2/3 large subunit